MIILSLNIVFGKLVRNLLLGGFRFLLFQSTVMEFIRSSVCMYNTRTYFILFHNSSHHFASVCFLLQEFRTCNGAAIIISCLGGNLGTNLKTGIGLMVAISAGTDAWIWSVLTPHKKTIFSPPSFVKVRKQSPCLAYYYYLLFLEIDTYSIPI